jgi:hypothetical protein
MFRRKHRRKLVDPTQHDFHIAMLHCYLAPDQ